MHSDGIASYLLDAELLICILTLVVLFWRRQLRDHKFVAYYLAVRVFYNSVSLWLLSDFAIHIEKHLRYRLYFYDYWISFAFEVALGFGIIYSVYRLAMEPLPGLQRLGMVMFRWAVGISLAVALAMAFGPHVTSGDFLIRFIGQLQQTESVLTLCLLLFVCVTIAPMGLSVRSKIFGICLGFGVNATTQLVSSAWLATYSSLYGGVAIVTAVATCVSLGIWTVYFAIPEPKRRIIMLPTTSPFLRWNQISAVLGDAPGFVALGTVTQDMFAPAEVEIMRRASTKMAQSYGD